MHIVENIELLLGPNLCYNIFMHSIFRFLWDAFIGVSPYLEPGILSLI